MKRKIRSAVILCAVICAVMLLLCTAASAAGTVVASGYCGREGNGTNLSWTLDSDGLLTISGTGKMRDFNYGSSPWYSNRTDIKSVTIGSGVTSIGDFAFYDCSSLTGITIPDGETSIGVDAFFGCSKLAYNSYDNAKYLGNQSNPYLVLVGASNANISSCTIHPNTRIIGDGAFAYCRSLTGIIFPNSVTSIGDGAFSNCSSLTDITIGSGVTSIGDDAFYNCSSLTGVTIPDSVTSIGAQAFSGCSMLTYNSYDNAKYLGNQSNPYLVLVEPSNTNISSYTIHSSTQIIGSEAFYGCSSLASITIGSSVTSIGSNAFSNCSSLKDVYITDLDAWCRISFGDVYANPMYYAGNIYCGGDKIVSATVPAGVTALNYTFYGFKDLIRVTLPNSLTAIGDYAFFNCGSLTKVTIPDGVTSIGSFAFSGCRSLTSVNIPDSVTSIGDYAFSGCGSLTSISIPDGVTSIGYNAFSGCSSLTSVSIPDSVTSIGNYAFSYCSSLTSISIPDGVTSIGSFAFSGCSSLTGVSIPDSVTSIGNDAFSGCGSLTSVSIPDSVTSIGDGAFYCYNLKDVYITDLDAWCRISFGDAEANPLYYAKNLYLNGAKVELLEIPESVQVVQSSLFRNASCIKAVSIPKTLIGVAANAFINCTGIEKVFFAGSEAEWNDLVISAGNEPLTGAQIFYNATPSDFLCKVTCAVSPGGTVSVAKNAYAPDEIVTVTATPYDGYELTELRVDGVKIEGNTFPATKNHTVSAVFSNLSGDGGTEYSRIGDIAVCASDGTPLQTLPTGQCLVTVPVENIRATESVTVMLTSYTADGQYQGLVWITFHNLPTGVTVDATLPIDNSSGKIAVLRAFVVGSLSDPAPLGNAVSFGTN